MKVAIAQISPIFLDRERTTAKAVEWIGQAAKIGAKLITFGETLIPAYPVWLCRTDGASFEDPYQKEIHARYLREAVCVEDGHLAPICEAASQCKISIVIGIAERPQDRGGHTIYCSRVVIGSSGQILSVHRKLMPTYEERLAWGTGDGAGLVTHRIGPFTLGALNCWENWMPLARTALYAQGEDLHVALWPGCLRLTKDITRFIALESRSYVISACTLIREQDVLTDFPQRERLGAAGEVYYDGGSCIAAPDGSWLVEPVVGREELLVAEIDHNVVLAERQNFDPVGHYSRPDVLELTVDRRRHEGAAFIDGDASD